MLVNLNDFAKYKSKFENDMDVLTSSFS